MASESISICINVVSLQCREKIFEHVLHILLVSASAHFLLFERHKQESSPLYLHHLATCGSNDELTSGAWSRCPQQPINPPVLATRQTPAPAANMSRQHWEQHLISSTAQILLSALHQSMNTATSYFCFLISL